MSPTDSVLPAQEEELRWVARANEGDRAAQAALFRAHMPGIHRLLLRLLASKADADDALQDAFVEAFRDLGQLKDAAVFGGWLRRIAVHQAHRRFRRYRFFSEADATLEQLADPGASAEVRAELAILDRALKKVSTEDRMAWMLRYVEGYELTEVAELCACSLATAKRRIAAAKARLANHLQLPEYGDE